MSSKCLQCLGKGYFQAFVLIKITPPSKVIATKRKLAEKDCDACNATGLKIENLPSLEDLINYYKGDFLYQKGLKHD